MDHDELCSLPLADVAGLIAAGDVSPVEVTGTLLDRISRLDPQLKSYALVLADEARAQAREAEQEITAGTYRGPLHGIPVAVKDIYYTAGVRTMAGTPMLTDHVPTFDAEAITRLREAGVVIIGKLNLSEWTFAGYHPDSIIPLNPWDPDRWTGLSSSGPAVATAAGLCFASLGSDTGGSIRGPAAACGIVGLKPTHGRISTYGVVALADSLDTMGPLTRTTRDAGIMLQSIVGYDSRDRVSRPEPVGDLLLEIDAGVRGIRIGFDEAYATDGVNPEVSAAVIQALNILEGLGAEIVEVRMPDLKDALMALMILMASDAVATHASTYPSRRDEYGPMIRDFLDIGAAITDEKRAWAERIRDVFSLALTGLFEQIDVFACPSSASYARIVTPELLCSGLGSDLEAVARGVRMTGPFNLNGAPALSLPSGFSSEGLPLSLQLVARRFDEQLLLRAGHAYEQATPWHTMHPPL